MKSRILMATLVVTLMLGVKSFAADCGACDPCNPCDNVACGKSCDLFSGLKKLIASKPCSATECGPCNGIVACSPCDNGTCDPCDAACGRSCFRPFKGLFAGHNSACGACDPACGNGDCGACDVAGHGNCDPCAACGNGDCGACDDAGCGNSCRPLFKNWFKRDRGCNPCDPCGTGNCDPCAANNGHCNGDCGACDNAGLCDPCDPCNNGCGKKFGSIFDKPRRNLKKFFDGFCTKNSCGPCDPCGLGNCGPCEVVDGGCPVPCTNVCPAANEAK